MTGPGLAEQDGGSDQQPDQQCENRQHGREKEQNQHGCKEIKQPFGDRDPCRKEFHGHGCIVTFRS